MHHTSTLNLKLCHMLITTWYKIAVQLLSPQLCCGVLPAPVCSVAPPPGAGAGRGGAVWDTFLTKGAGSGNRNTAFLGFYSLQITGQQQSVLASSVLSVEWQQLFLTAHNIGWQRHENGGDQLHWFGLHINTAPPAVWTFKSYCSYYILFYVQKIFICPCPQLCKFWRSVSLEEVVETFNESDNHLLCNNLYVYYLILIALLKN